jgi:lipid-binding SYLF domain-containing protein
MTGKLFAISVSFALGFALLPGLSVAQKKEKDPAAQRAQIHADVVKAIANFKASDPSIDKFFKTSVGYAVFARVGKAGFIVGGGAGDGELYEKGKVVGYAHIGMGSVGLQIGVQEFSQIVFFKDAAALERFKQNKFEFAANASAVIVKAGGADAADYKESVAIFVKPTGGAMAELSLGTQKFNYKPDAK